MPRERRTGVVALIQPKVWRMLSKEVLRRLSELNQQPDSVSPQSRLQARARSNGADRSPLRRTPEHSASTVAKVDDPTGVQPAESLASKAREATQTSAANQGAIARADVPASSELPEGREIETPLGRHFIFERPLHELWEGAERWLGRLSDHNRSSPPADTQPDANPDPLEQMRAALPDAVMFLDLETCGFSGSMVFLAGVLVAGPEGMTLVQLLARHYAEERAMIHTLWQIASQQQVLATFNGKSFDWPVVRDRSTLHHIEQLGPLARQDAPHCDLLHLSRRRWRKQLPNCKLQTLERYVCGRHRTGDIPGHEIPDAYHQYVRSGDAWEMRNILHHNALDLVTLFQLSLALLVED